jgi:hypothetical protein
LIKRFSWSLSNGWQPVLKWLLKKLHNVSSKELTPVLLHERIELLNLPPTSDLPLYYWRSKDQTALEIVGDPA